MEPAVTDYNKELILSSVIPVSGEHFEVDFLVKGDVNIDVKLSFLQSCFSSRLDRNKREIIKAERTHIKQLAFIL